MCLSGPLGPRAAAELAAVQAMRRQVEEQLTLLGRKEAMIVALVAEAAGCAAGPSTRFDYDLDPPAWRVVES